MDANSGRISYSFQSPRQGLSVRCVRDTGILPILNSFSTTVTNITANTANSGGQVTSDGGNIETTRGVVWSTSSNPTITMNTKTVDGSGIGTFTSVITGLNANTTYYLRAYATNQIGTAYGTEVSFTTLGPPKQVTIGSQNWTDKNLDVATYSDGTLIPEVQDPQQWANLTTGAWCYSNDKTYGKLYNWYAVAGIWNEASKTDETQRKKLAPTDYHIPSDDEWNTLINYLGGYNQPSVAGGKMKETGTSHWNFPNSDATNSTGFTALPGGYRNVNDGNFYNIGFLGYFWSASDSINYLTDAWYRVLNYAGGNIVSNLTSKPNGLSVRCVSDEVLSNKTFEANSFKIYPNPASSVLNIKANDNLANQPFIITDTLGKIVLKGKLNEGDNSINVEQLSKGIYYFKVANDKASKFIKE